MREFQALITTGPTLHHTSNSVRKRQECSPCGRQWPTQRWGWRWGDGDTFVICFKDKIQYCLMNWMRRLKEKKNKILPMTRGKYKRYLFPSNSLKDRNFSRIYEPLYIHI